MLLGLIPNVGPVELLLLLATLLVIVWPICRICSKAGFPWPIGLMVLIPALNLVLLFVLAFAEWPALRDAKRGTDPDAWRLR